MKKFLLSFAVFTLALLLFASCGGEETNQTTSNTTLPDTTPESTVVTTVKTEGTTTVATTPVTEPTTQPTTDTSAKPSTTSTAPQDTTTPQVTTEPIVPTLPSPLCLNEINKVTVKAIAFEKDNTFGNNVYLTYVFNDNATDIDTQMLNGMKNKTVYAALRINNELFRIDDYKTSGVYLYCNLEKAGAMLLAGVSYSLSLEFYNSNDSLLYYSRNELLASTMNTQKIPERTALTVTLPETGLKKTSIKQNSLSSGSLEPARGSSLAFLFDGNSSVNKFLGTVGEGIPTVYFSLNQAETLTHYTFRTANDIAAYPERLPAGWRLYGKVGEMWMLLSKVESSPTHETGLKATNLAAFSYAITSPCTCREYKIEFTFQSSMMSLGDIELYTTEGFSAATPDPNAGKLLSGIAGVQATLSDFRLIPELQNRVGVAYYLASETSLVSEIQNGLASGDMFAAITLDKNIYQITDFAISGNYISFDLQSAGAPVFSGVIYQVSLGIYAASGERLYYTNAEPLSSAYQTPNLPPRAGMNVTLPGGLTEVKVNTNSVQAEDFVPFPDGDPKQFFDGDTNFAKIGGTIENGTFTLTFSLRSSETLTYYTFYTGNDTSSHPERNPIGWQLFGKVGDDYVLLSDVRENAVAYHGMQGVNATPYSYKIDTPTACKDYMIVFDTNQMFQLCEMILYK